MPVPVRMLSMLGTGVAEIRIGSSAAIQQHCAEWLLTDPKADVRVSELEWPLWVDCVEKLAHEYFEAILAQQWFAQPIEFD